MSFPKYADYTESQLEYIGPFPSNWDLVPFFSKFIARKESNKGMKNDNLLSLSYGRIIPKDINTLDGLLPASYETYQVVHPGDLVFRLTDLQNDKRSLRSAIVTEEGIITSAYLAVRPKAMNPDFANHLFRCYDQLKVFYSMGGGLRQSMKYDDMKWLPVVSPSLSEQTQIARFLDHETAKIDALIAEQKRLIKLLQEKRQAIISHAVTKGLDPNVPMKDSGVEWLGEVPAHWGIRKVSYEFIAVKGPRGALLTKEYCATNKGPYPVYSGQTDNAGVLGSINDFDFSLGSNGGLLTTTVGAKAMSLNFVTNHISLSQNCMLIRPLSGQIFIKFYLYHLQPLFRLERGMIPDHMQPSFRMEDLYRFFVARPPVEEQKAIASYLDELVMKVDMLINEAGNSINLMQERRSALISAAVTGKIDVRDWQPPADESAFDEDVRKAGLEASA